MRGFKNKVWFFSWFKVQRILHECSFVLKKTSHLEEQQKKSQFFFLLKNSILRKRKTFELSGTVFFQPGANPIQEIKYHKDGLKLSHSVSVPIFYSVKWFILFLNVSLSRWAVKTTPCQVGVTWEQQNKGQ